MSSSDSCRGSAISAAGAAGAVVAERLDHGCLVRGFKPRGETHAISAIVGRFNKAMATTLFNTTGYVSSPAWHSAHSCTSQIERLGLHLSIPVITQTPEL